MNSQGEINYLYKSSDGGDTWKLLHTFNEGLTIQSMSAPTSDNLYFGFDKGALMKSLDDGQTTSKNRIISKIIKTFLSFTTS
jgi:photosystem II stability/assembly factor-like uncharacterized protein